MKRKLLLFSLCICLCLENPLHCVVILIHGTFAAGTVWSRPGGNFYDILEKEAAKINQKLIPFTWTGNLGDNARLQGAEALAKIILSYPETEAFTLIGHSHGGNIITLASKLLNDPIERLLANHENIDIDKLLDEMYELIFGKDDQSPQVMASAQKAQKEVPQPRALPLTKMTQSPNEIQQMKEQLFITCLNIQTLKKERAKIRTLKNDYLIDAAYLIATPIDMKKYNPDMEMIKTVYNLYSKGDVVQPVLGLYRRLIPDHPHVVNLRITIENSGGITGWFHENPTHTEIHRPVVAKWLLSIPHKLKADKIGGFENFTTTRNGKIHFNEEDNPTYKADKKTTDEREAKEKDRQEKATLQATLQR